MWYVGYVCICAIFLQAHTMNATLSTFHRQQRQKGHPIARLVNAVNHIERIHKKPISLALTEEKTKRCILEVCPASSSDYGAPGCFRQSGSSVCLKLGNRYFLLRNMIWFAKAWDGQVSKFIQIREISRQSHAAGLDPAKTGAVMDLGSNAVRWFCWMSHKQPQQEALPDQCQSTPYRMLR